MDAGKLFSELVNRQPDQSGGILTGTAVSDSVDGTVMVQMDGSVVAQPGEDEVTLTVSADDFVDGSYVLPSVPYAGSLTITDSDNNELEEQDYELDGARLTIFALSSSPVDIAYQTQVQQQVTNDDFDGDRYSLASTTNLTVEEMDSDGSWSPATYTLDGNILTISGIEHQAGIVAFTYVYDVSVVCEPGENVLPDSPDEVSVLGRNSSGVDVVVTDYALDGNVITLPSTYDAYTVDYPVTTTEEWNVSDQYQEEPLEDSDDAADPAIVTIGHNLQWPPASVVSCTIDGTAATYMLDDVNVVVDAPAVTERWFRLTYDAPVSLQVPASVFASGAFTLPSIPLGSVSTVRAGVVLENTVDDGQLSIASLVVDSPTYSIAYTEQVEQDVVELPCTPYVAEGQFVEIAVVNGMPTVIGASGSGDVTMTLAGDAADAAAAAEEAAAAAQEIAEATGQHFWAADDGIHVTEVTEEEWNDSTGQSYHSGANVLISSIGQLFRTGLNNLLGFVTNPVTGVAIFDGLGNAAANVVGLFTASGLILGRSTESHAEVDYHSLQLVDKEDDAYFHVSDLRDETGVATITETLLGHRSELSYRVTLPVTTASDCSVKVNGTSVTFNVADGDRTFTLDSAPAEFSTIEITYNTTDQNAKAYSLGFRTGAAGPMSLAVGPDAEAAGGYSYAGGRMAKAWGRTAYATGDHATAWGYASAAEGNYTDALGSSSRAQNEATIANGDAQTALGRYNVPDTTSAVIIGNGTGDAARSNALTVDWDGNVEAGRIVDLHVNPTNGADYDTRLVAASDGTNFSVFVRDPANTNEVTQFYLYGGAAGSGANGRIMQRTSTDGGTTWSARYGVRSPWTLVGSTTGTTALSYDLTHYDEVCIVARYSTAYLGSIVLPKAALHASTEYEAYLGGWGNPNTNSNRRAVAKVTRSKLTPVVVTTDQTDRTSNSTWYVYAR